MKEKKGKIIVLKGEENSGKSGILRNFTKQYLGENKDNIKIISFKIHKEGYQPKKKN